MKLKDFVNLTKNRRTNQESFNLRKIKLKEHNISIDDLLKTEINKKIIKFNKA